MSAATPSVRPSERFALTPGARCRPCLAHPCSRIRRFCERQESVRLGLACAIIELTKLLLEGPYEVSFVHKGLSKEGGQDG